MDGASRRTFWAGEGVAAYERRCWETDAFAAGDIELSRARYLMRYARAAVRHLRTEVRAWLDDGLPRWRQAPPVWFTPEWVGGEWKPAGAHKPPKTSLVPGLNGTLKPNAAAHKKAGHGAHGSSV